MRRGVKIALALVAALAVLLAINTVIVDGQTKDAEVTVDGGRILHLPSGDVQVVDQGVGGGRPPSGGSASAAALPIVLLHCYGCSLHWFDDLTPLLARHHRVIRIDLLGFGGSEKPKSGYSMEDQAATVATALNQLGVQGAVIVGHSMGFSVATALASEHSELVDRLVNIDEGPRPDDCDLPFTAKLESAPVLGEALWRVTPSFLVKDGYSSAFAPGYDVPDFAVDDYRAMTYTSFDDSASANEDYRDSESLADRLRPLAIPLLSIFGSDDQICDPQSSQEAYQSVPGARVAEVKGAGHSPNVEKPAETAALIGEFAAEAGDESESPPKGGRRPGKRR
ncbi:MAG: alpha/beta fold hydrolase [Solirubrobacterales bacterium]